MAIQDSDPERRNLMVTSLAFIIYYLAGGKVEDNEVRLHVVNVTFEKPDVLALFAWVLLFWFAWRYWLTHPHKARVSNIDDTRALANSKIVLWYTSKATGLKPNRIGGFAIASLEKDVPGWVVRYVVNEEGTEDESGKLVSVTKNRKEGPLQIIGWRGFVTKTLLKVMALINKPGFSSYSVPYIVFALAVTIPVYYKVSC